MAPLEFVLKALLISLDGFRVGYYNNQFFLAFEWRWRLRLRYNYMQNSLLLLRGAPDYSTDTVLELTCRSTTGNCETL